MPPIVRRKWGPVGVEWVSRWGLQYLPSSLADAAVNLCIALHFGRDWWRTAGDLPPNTQTWKAFATGRVPVIDKWAGRAGGGGLVNPDPQSSNPEP